MLHRTGEPEVAVEAEFEDASGKRSVVVQHSAQGKQITIDGKVTRDRKEMIASVPAVVFCHDDIQYVTGPPEMQRWFVNQSHTLVDVSYVDDLRRYGRLLKMRNSALRDEQMGVIDALDIQLAPVGIRLVDRRRQIVSQFAPILQELFGLVFGGKWQLSMKYRTSWSEYDVAEAVTALQQKRTRDLDMRTTTHGPHRDRFPLELNGRPLVEIASTGQLRLVSLLLRVGQARLLSQLLKIKPILLLDDVLLELDPERRQRFVSALPEYQQAFFTFLPDEQYARFAEGSTITYNVVSGTLNAQC